MHEHITIAHDLPLFDVTEDSELLASTGGTYVLRTKGELAWKQRRACPHCAGAMHVHDIQRVRLRHIPMLGTPHFLEVTFRRYRCACCGLVRAQEIPFKSARHMMTGALEDLVCEYLSYGLTLKAVNRLLGVHAHTVKEMDKARLGKRYGGPPKEHARHLAIDEISIHRHHRYATVVLDLDSGHVLFCEAGKGKAQAEHFMRWAGNRWMKHVQAVAMDMNAQYDSAFRHLAPHVRIVYDRFHLMKQYNDNVLTRIRRRLQDEARESHDRKTYDTLKGGRFVLLSKPGTLLGKDEAARRNNRHISQAYEVKGLEVPPGMRKMRVDNESRLRRLMDVNRDLNTAYVLSEQFRLAYQVKDPLLLEEGLRDWCAIATRSGIPELALFRDLVVRHMDGIVNHARFDISTGRLEGTNNLAKVIKRNAYGFHDDQYYFLKLIDASHRPKFKPSSHKFLL